METWRVIKDNGPINTVISANKIFTGQHWVGIFDITTQEKEREGKLSAKNIWHYFKLEFNEVITRR